MTYQEMVKRDRDRRIALHRRELAERILVANYPSPGIAGMSHAAIAADAVAMADALMAELAK